MLNESDMKISRAVEFAKSEGAPLLTFGEPLSLNHFVFKISGQVTASALGYRAAAWSAQSSPHGNSTKLLPNSVSMERLARKSTARIKSAGVCEACDHMEFDPRTSSDCGLWREC